MVTLEKRVEDLECVIAHLPDDLNARFAGVDVKLAMIREAQALHTQRFTTLDAKVDGLAADVTKLKSDVSTLKSDVSTLKSDVGEIKSHMVEILARLPKA